VITRPCCLVALILLAGCDIPGRPRPEDRFVPPHSELSFRVLYQQNCSGCHGADGTVGPAPPLNDLIFRSIVSEKELRQIIEEGRAGTLMPPFGDKYGGPLTAAQIQVLTREIKGVPDPQGAAPQWELLEPQPGAPSYLEPSRSSGNKQRGLNVFGQACAPCHGEQGQGGDKGGAINNPDFLALISDQTLRRIVITGRPDLGMPDYADAMRRGEDFKPLTSQDVSDIVALLSSWRAEEKSK
jgi:cytochrome c oxidase cbb3-type subunit III